MRWPVGFEIDHHAMDRLVARQDKDLIAKCPYGVPGDRLWVKEEHYLCGIWRIEGRLANGKPKYRFEIDRDMGVQFDTMPNGTITGGRSTEVHGWYKRIGMFMPRWASRGLDEVVSVSVDRLQAISESDAWSEGCKPGDPDDAGGFFPAEEPDPSGIGFRGWDNATDWYADLWESINGAGSWDANPWVWRVEFKVITP
ncbi:MAG: hypothetical protein ABI893_00595 [Polaromonas sp.]